MAVAEARAAWQRTANRCFVQEDAKRAPKLACCQSSSSSKDIDGGPINAADVPENASAGFIPIHKNPSYSNLPPDTRWWLQLQPGYGYQKGFTCDQLNALEAEMETLRAEIVNTPSKGGEFQPHDDRGSAHFDVNKNHVTRTLFDDNTQEFIEPKVKKENSKSMDMDPFGCFRFQKADEYCFDSESPFIGGEKNVPWWRSTDKDDLASLVAQKSLNYVANCDLPPPQTTHIRRYSKDRPGSSDHDSTIPSSLNLQAQPGHASSANSHGHSHLSSKTLDRRKRASIDGHLPSGLNKPFSSSTAYRDTTEIGQIPEGDACKAQLLEALRHSQTRAREAEKVAKQAYAEKEHIIKLFFRQASQLFAYKQWFQLLQLETLYYQVKNGEPPMSALFPMALPWMPQKGRKQRKNWQKSTRGKRGKHSQPTHDVSKYAVALALGLGLVGAGLLLGWTAGWLLPI